MNARGKAKKSRTKLPKVPCSKQFDNRITLPPLSFPAVSGPCLFSDDGKARHHSVAEIKKALIHAHGFRSIAAALLGMTHRGLNERISQSAELREIADDMNEELLDHAEARLFERIEADDLAAIKFYLRCKGQKRGWSERYSGDLLNEQRGAFSPPNVIVHFQTEVKGIGQSTDSGIPEPDEINEKDS
jgi:hypothetical protein